MGCRFYRLDEPVLIAGSKPLLTEFGIHHRLESCGMCSVNSTIVSVANQQNPVGKDTVIFLCSSEAFS